VQTAFIRLLFLYAKSANSLGEFLAELRIQPGGRPRFVAENPPKVVMRTPTDSNIPLREIDTAVKAICPSFPSCYSSSSASAYLKHFPQYCELSSNGSVQLSLAESCVNLCGLGLHLCGKCSRLLTVTFMIFHLNGGFVLLNKSNPLLLRLLQMAEAAREFFL
jgi:hypothetical protein